MSSLNKSGQARLNGAKSRGPVTTEGKARSARNAIKHGFTAQPASIVTMFESQPRFVELRDEYYAHFQPSDPVERDLVDQMICAQWRLRRYLGIETTLFDLKIAGRKDSMKEQWVSPTGADHIADAFECLAGGSNALELAQRYAVSLERSYRQALKDLLELRRLSEQREPPPEPAVEAAPPEPEIETNPPTLSNQPIPFPLPPPDTPAAEQEDRVA